MTRFASLPAWFAIVTTTACAAQRPAAWQAWAAPEHAGFAAAPLDSARAFADSNRAAAVLVVASGRVVAAWGAIDRPFMAHSLRKSLAWALYGMAIAEGRLELTTTLAELGVDDVPPLSAPEQRATFQDLIAARSGVYHAAAYASDAQESERPARGAHAPGTRFYYNNWDFNVAEAIYERAVGEDYYASFARRLARPLGMEDFDLAAQFEVLEPSQSRYPAHTLRVSARDLARVGLLLLQEGRWNGVQLLPVDWVRSSLTRHSATGERTGYGWLWWIYETGAMGAAYPHLDRMPVYLARGTGGHAMFVLPAVDMVIVHRGDTDNDRPVAGRAIWQLVERLVAARIGPPRADSRAVPVQAQLLASNVPPPICSPSVVPSSELRRRVAGDYLIAPGAVARVYEYEGRLFMSVPRFGEAELFATGPLTFTVRVRSDVSVTFTAAPDGGIAGLVATIGSQVIRAERR